MVGREFLPVELERQQEEPEWCPEVEPEVKVIRTCHNQVLDGGPWASSNFSRYDGE